MNDLTSDSSTPIISVVIPAYNAEETIANTIKTVQEQSFEAWELIVIDDCSTDKTREIVRNFAKSDDRIQLIELQINNGCPAPPRNVGAQAARGEWIALLDSDDLWHPRKLEMQLDEVSKHNCDFCSTQLEFFQDEKQLKPAAKPDYEVKVISFLHQKIRNQIPNSSVLVKKSLLLKHPFNEDFRYKAVEDFHCWIQIHRDIGMSIKLMYPFLHYRVSDQQISGSKLKMLKRVFMVHKEYHNGSLAIASMLTFTHAAGAFYSKYLRKTM